MLLGRLRIRGKLALLAAIPLLAVIALTIPLVINQATVADHAGDTARSVRVAGQVGSLVQDLQQERLLAAGYLVGSADATDLTQQAATVTDRITDVRDDFGDALPAEVRTAIDGVRDLTAVRTAVVARKTTPEQTVAAFGAVIAKLITALHLGERLDLTQRGNREVVALDAVLRVDEGITTAATHMVIAAANRSQVAIGQITASFANTQSGIDRVQTFGTPDQFALFNLVIQAAVQRSGNDFIARLAANPAQAVASLSVSTLFPSMLSFITLGRFVEKKIATEVTSEVTGRQHQALTFAYGAAAVALLLLLAVAGLSLAVASAVARPLTRLTRSADRVARVTEEELERVADDESESATAVHLAPVDVRAEDEIGDLARAFERVQETAARLVERQVASRRNVAQMFGHVGRRTQNLVGRQIALIDQLERDEEDPGRLQNLYRLDHVSSRLRRNAGSLVVLSGRTGAQEHLAPLPLSDAVRLALGEIEDYTRVDVDIPENLVLAPAIVGDLVLILAELMENATAFSPPHTRVTVSAASFGGGARLSIVDHGLGLTAERLAEENARLARRERLDLAPTEVLGLFVVGRLARRHGFAVTLSATPGGGLTAVIEMSERLLTLVPLYAAPHVAAAPVAFDTAELNRTLQAAPSWNAFASARPAEPVEPAPQVLRRRVRGAQLPTGTSSPPPAPAAPPDAEAARALVEEFEAGVRRATTRPTKPLDQPPTLSRRVPGASLEPMPERPARPPADQPPPDPDQARNLIEQFESGVARALREAQHEEGSPR